MKDLTEIVVGYNNDQNKSYIIISKYQENLIKYFNDYPIDIVIKITDSYTDPLVHLFTYDDSSQHIELMINKVIQFLKNIAEQQYESFQNMFDNLNQYKVNIKKNRMGTDQMNTNDNYLIEIIV